LASPDVSGLETLPLVSVGIPLYRSSRFLETIVENIESIRYPNVEILISDRHSLDDTMDVLQQRYGADNRFRFFRETDRIGWVDNFNFLLQQAKGTYFACMPHDDSFPPAFIGELVAVLEQHQDAVLAFGRVEQLSVDGFLPTFPSSAPPISQQDPWTIGSSLRLLTLWQLWIAYRGIVRRNLVEKCGLYMRRTYRDVRADIYWVFALSLRGRLVYVPSCSYTKRFYKSSTGADWAFGVRQSLDAFRVLRSYLKDYARSGRDGLFGQVVVFPWCIVQGILPPSAARRLGIITRRTLLARRWREARTR
jgi:glycosyltransferase involved in cell wall biosynthesis